MNNSELTIGVTGHRNLNSIFIADILTEVKEQLLSLQEISNGACLVVVSGLAEGSDRLVAQVGLELSIRHDALLPTSIHEYESDFIDLDSRREFMSLVNASTNVFNASVSCGLSSEYSERPNIYVNLLDQLCKRCDVLIALWDGKKDTGPGGTYDVVRSFLERSKDIKPAWNSVLKGRVLHIHVPRVGRSFPVSSQWLRSVEEC